MIPSAMNIQTSRSFWWNDLKSERGPKECPVKGCENKSTDTCEEHGLEIHRKTFVYYNGDTPQEKRKARLRNFLPGGRRFLLDFILQNKNKAETHRLGSENSEDALTWNVFGELHRRGLLHLPYGYLTGDEAGTEQVKLFLWGLEIDFVHASIIPCEFLNDVRGRLESGITRFRTEPDVMLLGPNQLVLIEAKFTSGNTLCAEGRDVIGEKPRSRSGLIQRYIKQNTLWQPILRGEDVGGTVHSQLLRMIVFASTMAQRLRKESSFSDLMLFESAEAPGVPLEDVQEVSNYVAAMNHGLRRLREDFPLSLRLMREIHKILLSKGRGSQKRPGEFRESQNWIPATAEQLSLSAPTVAKALQHMVKLGMVRETTGKQRHRLFTYHRYLEILNRGTELPKTSH
jgi:hypothetical protein